MMHSMASKNHNSHKYSKHSLRTNTIHYNSGRWQGRGCMHFIII